jgi:Smg protein
MFEVLMFLFENYMNSTAALRVDNETILLELERIGFDRYEVGRALQWLNGLIQFQLTVVPRHKLTALAIRHYLPEEAEHLGVQGRGLLLYLEKIGVLDPISREMVIDRLMALDYNEVDIGRIKWVVLMVLFNQPDKKSALSLMQEMDLADAPNVIH